MIGGVLILWAERRKHVISTPTVDDLNWRRALAVGFAQALAMIPGTSRSGATIIGGLFLGLSRKSRGGVLLPARHPHHVRRHRLRPLQELAAVRL